MLSSVSPFYSHKSEKTSKEDSPSELKEIILLREQLNIQNKLVHQLLSLVNIPVTLQNDKNTITQFNTLQSGIENKNKLFTQTELDIKIQSIQSLQLSILEKYELRKKKDELMNKIKTVLDSKMNDEKFAKLKTKNGKTQNSEDSCVKIIQSVLDEMKLSYEKASSQQPKDFRDVGKIGLDIEVKKTDGNTIRFNDTCPDEDIYYIVIYTGKVYKTKQEKKGKVLVLNGSYFLENTESWLPIYKKDITRLKDGYGRGDNKKRLKCRLSVYARPNYSGDISDLI
jgi:hypothetical protein